MMTWVFAALVVLALGGIAVVASGATAPMKTVEPDRPPSNVPVDGPLRAEDVRRARFSTAVRGYRMSEVDALLDRLARQLDDAERRATAIHGLSDGSADNSADSGPDGTGDGTTTTG